MDWAIRHLSAAHRFTTWVDGVECVLEYILDETAAAPLDEAAAAPLDGAAAARVMTIVHTGVPPAVGGRGVAGALVQAAIDAARAEGWKVRPACTYAAAWLARHPAYQDLLA